MLLEKFVKCFIGFVFCFIIGTFILYGVLAYKVVNKVDEQDFSNGIKPVIEKIWCGQPGCLDKSEGAK